MLTLSRISNQARHKQGRSGYADPALSSSKPQRATLRNMFSPVPNAPEERPTRKLKKENRFYNFLTGSRSRSHSKTDLSPPIKPDPQPKPSRNNRPDSKPPHRIPSRPISSTTTATNSTITPGTPKAKKHTPSSIPVPSSRRQEPPKDDTRRSRPTSPTHSIPTHRKINIFGISIRRPSLSSSKSRSRSHSRPGTPLVSADIPPLPTFGFDDDPRGAQPSQSPSRPASPTPHRTRPDPTTTTTTTSATPLSLGPLVSTSHGHDPPPTQAKDANDLEPHGGSSKLRGFFAGRDSSRSRDQSSSGVPANLVSAPTKRVSSLKRHSLNKTLPDRPTSPPAADPPPASPSSANSKSNIPRIIHTPATPVRAATISEGAANSVTTTGASTTGSRLGLRNRSLDNGYRYRGTMDVVDEEGRLSRESKEMQQLQQLQQQKPSAIPRFTSKEKEKEPEAPARTPSRRKSLQRMSTSVRNTKHGSFDFERPGLGAVALQRTGSNGTTTTVTSGWSRNEVSNVRESTWGPGLAGVGTIQRDVSVKRGKEREEQVKEREERAKELKKQAKEIGAKKVGSQDSEPPTKTNPSPAHSSNGHQTPPSGTTSGKSSSLSKASGRRFFGKGLSRSNTTQHGLFSFEPPVPSPTWSTTAVITTKEISPPWDSRTEGVPGRRSRKEKDNYQNPDLVQQVPVERKPTQRRDRSTIPAPKVPNAGHRSGVKGRSLDLNIGLAWAPSKVREDALLASSSLFKRSLSTSSSVTASGSRSANSSAHGHDSTSTSREDGMGMGMGEQSKIGREVAELFRKALGEARYMRFKTYIYQFDAHEIPFDGPSGIISKVDGLLATVPTLGLDEKRRLLDKLVRIILQNA